MKTSFEIITSGFARHVLGNRLSGDPVCDAIRALHMNHNLATGKTSRLTKWAIFRESGSSISSELTSYPSGDKRTLKEAFVSEILNFKEPVVFAIFTNALLCTEHLRATYDVRRVALCSPNGIEMFNAVDPEDTHWIAKAYRTEVEKNAA